MFVYNWEVTTNLYNFLFRKVAFNVGKAYSSSLVDTKMGLDSGGRVFSCEFSYRHF